MIKAVIFDVDGVLIDSFEANHKFHQDLMKHTGFPPPTKEEYAAQFHSPLLENIRVLTKLKSEEEVRKIWQMGIDRVVPYPGHLVDLNKNAGKIIKLLSKKYILGIASSRFKKSIAEMPELAKLHKYLKATVWYEDTVNHKPHPEPLLLAMSQLKVSPKESVYIGDGITDIQAAKAAGMKSIAYPLPLEGADAWVSSFDELPDAILKL